MISFLVIVLLTYWFSELELIYLDFSPNSIKKNTIIKLSVIDCLYLAATTCATDCVASLTIIKEKEFPKLFSIIFGESTFNDVVAIILVQSLQLISNGNNELTVDGIVVGKIIGNFLEISVLSILIGIGCGK